ncbi:isoaspartyl peptidase/L-asparaginase [candidate division TA06 bacterium]|nr:isoaspartyl peptidase/L-asparaginase [candidate division TA06 bacterium]
MILVHGGAGRRNPSRRGLRTLRETLERGFSILEEGGRALDAVEETIRILEDDETFNAGRGSRLQLDGVARMDASIMEGKTLQAGAVASIQGIKNPISAARLVMEKTPHVLMVGERAARFGVSLGLETGNVATPSTRKELEQGLRSQKEIIQIYNTSFGRTSRFSGSPAGGETVGAVALDREGNLAAGSSTGGSALMLPGRVGDTPIVGSGVYADNQVGAVSSTGMGESIIRVVLAKEICTTMEKGFSPLKASRRSLERMAKRVGGTAGVITLRRDGRFALVHNSEYMGGGVQVEGRKPVVNSHWLNG